MSTIEFDGKVAFVRNPLSVVVNIGTEQGVKEGDKFIVFGMGPEIVDPDTKESLGSLEVYKGRGVVVHAQEKISTIEPYEHKKVTQKLIKQPPQDPFSNLANLAKIAAGGTAGDQFVEIVERPIAFYDVRPGDFVRHI